MFHYLYQITNLANNKIYIGVHSTEDLEDGYMGSGVALARAFKKYGVDSFEKTILEFFETREALYEREREIVNESFIQDSGNYNSRVGGVGGDTYSLKEKEELYEIRKKKKDSWRKRTALGVPRHKQTEESREKIRKARALQIISEETKQKMWAARRGISLSEDHKKRISDSVRESWKKRRKEKEK